MPPDSPPRATHKKRPSNTPKAKEVRSEQDKVRSTARWQSKRAYQLSLYPICQRCTHLKQLNHNSTINLSVHHVVPMRLAMDLSFEDSNLLVLCRPCHSHFDSMEARKMYEESVKQGREIRDLTDDEG